MQLRIYEIFDAKLLYDNAGTVAEVDVSYANNASFSPEESTIDFEGDGQVTKLYLQSGLTVELTADAWSLGALDTIFKDTPVTTGLPTGVAARRYMGKKKQSGVKAGLKCQANAINDADNTTRVVDIYVPVGTLSAVAAPTLQSKQKSQMKLKLSAEQTDKDMAGDALPGLTAGEKTTWFIDVHSAPA